MAKKTSKGRKGKKQGSGSAGKASGSTYNFGRLKKLKVNTISVYASTPSDRFLKRDLEPISGALEKVKQLTAYRFSWKDWNASAKKQVGLLAQDVEKVLPEAVSRHADPAALQGDSIDTLGVDYANVTALLVEAIKEQQREIDELRRRLS